MAGIGGEAFGSAIGGFFKQPPLKTIRYSDTLGDTQGQQALALRDLIPRSQQAAAEYGAAVRASTPQVKSITDDTIVTLGDLARKYAMSLDPADPIDTLERIRSGSFGAIGKEAQNIANYGLRDRKLKLLKMGYGGRGESSYANKQAFDSIGANFVPLYLSVLSTLGSDTNTVNSGRLANLAATMELLRQRQALPGFADARTLLPYQFESGALGNQIAQGGALSEALKTNTAGFQQPVNKWTNFFQQMGRSADQQADSIQSLAETAIKAYAGGGGAGMLG